jgi:hypothetical protein
MAINFLLKRSTTASKRPTAAQLDIGELSLNYDADTAGVFFEDSAGNVRKVGPAEVSATAPNASPAGSSGNSSGELWYDTSVGNLKIFDGTSFVDATTAGAAGGSDTQVQFNSTGSLAGSANFTFNGTTASIAGLSILGTSRFGLAATQDAIELLGRNGGTSSFRVALRPATLSANRTQDLQNLGGVVALDVNKLNFFAATTSAELAGVISDETGSGALVFATSPTLTTPAIGAATGTSLSLTGDITIGDKIIHAGDTDTAIRFPAADTIAFETNNAERARIDSSGRLLVGTSSGRTGSNFKDAGYTNQLQTEGAADNQSYGPTFIANSGTTNNTLRGCIATLGRTRGTALASNTAVASGDLIGRLQFSGADGTNLVPAASITAFVDGTPGADDMPGRLVFSTTADGASAPTERMRIDSAGNVGIGTGSLTVRAEATQDGVTLAGRGGGSGTFGVTISPTTLTANRTLTLADSNTTLQGGTMAVTGGTLAQFAATTSAELAGVISDETGSGALVFAASPTLSGTPLSTTAAVDTNTTQIATTAYVVGQASATNPLGLGTAAIGTSLRYARQDHVHPTAGLGLTSGTLAQFAATTSSQLAGVISDETGSGALVFATSPSLTTPAIGAATGTSLGLTGGNLTVTSGNLGVGTASPTELVHFENNSLFTVLLKRVGAAPSECSLSNAGNVLKLGNNGSGITFEVGTTPAERARLDSVGRFLIGTSIAQSTSSGALTPHFQVNSPNSNVSSASLGVFANSATSSPAVRLYRNRATTAGGFDYTGGTVQTDDFLGTIDFAGVDAAATPVMRSGAIIRAICESTPTGAMMPTRLIFSLGGTSVAQPAEVLRITSEGVIAYDQPTPTSKSGAATLTVAELKTGIIQYTGSAATLSLPTGTLTEGGFNGIYTNMAFEWSVINTGSGTCTIGNGTGHTVTGSNTAAAGTSARFASRRTAANTFVAYRLS